MKSREFRQVRIVLETISAEMQELSARVGNLARQMLSGDVSWMHVEDQDALAKLVELHSNESSPPSTSGRRQGRCGQRLRKARPGKRPMSDPERLFLSSVGDPCDSLFKETDLQSPSHRLELLDYLHRVDSEAHAHAAQALQAALEERGLSQAPPLDNRAWDDLGEEVYSNPLFQ